MKYVPRKGGKGIWCYAEKGQSHHHRHHHRHHANHKVSPTLVFLHGFGADKDSWPSMIRLIPKHYHCVVIDMPGHGETTFVEGHDQLTIESYKESIREFLAVTGLDKEPVHLIGLVILCITGDAWLVSKISNSNISKSKKDKGVRFLH